MAVIFQCAVGCLRLKRCLSGWRLHQLAWNFSMKAGRCGPWARTKKQFLACPCISRTRRWARSKCPRAKAQCFTYVSYQSFRATASRRPKSSIGVRKDTAISPFPARTTGRHTSSSWLRGPCACCWLPMVFEVGSRAGCVACGAIVTKASGGVEKPLR